MLMGFCLGRGARKPWAVLASWPRGYQTILEHLLRRLTSHQKARGLEPGHRGEVSALIVSQGPQRGWGLSGTPDTLS